MSNDEWFWIIISTIGGLTLTSIFKSIFYYRYESKRQIELARIKKHNPTTATKGEVDR